MRWSGEVWRWLVGIVVLVAVSLVTWTWAVAGTKQTMERSVDAVAGRLDMLQAKVDANERQMSALIAGVLKEIDAREARQRAEAAAVERRLVTLENQARDAGAVLVALEGLKTEVRFLSAKVAEIKDDIKEDKRRSGP